MWGRVFASAAFRTSIAASSMAVLLQAPSRLGLPQALADPAPMALADPAPSTTPFFKPTVALTLAGAKHAMEAAAKEAEANGWAVTIVISDMSGTPLLLERHGSSPMTVEIAMVSCDEATPDRTSLRLLSVLLLPHLLAMVSIPTFQGKARTAAISGKETARLEESANGSPEQRPRLALLSAPVLLMEGGVPILYDGKCVGAIGVSGVRSDQDAQVAKAGIRALLAG